MTDYVLVHGTTQAPSCWDRVGHELIRRGHRALPVDLPVDQPDLLADDYARIAAGQVADDVRNPVVVAHSGGGLVASALARRLHAAHVVWLAAFVPDFAGGRSMRDQVTAELDTMFHPDWPRWESDKPAESAYFLFHSCDLATLRWAIETLRPWRPAAAIDEPAGRAPDVPSTYVLPLQDRTLTPAWMRAAAADRLGATTIEIDGDHCPHMARATLVAGLLAGLGNAD